MRKDVFYEKFMDFLEIDSVETLTDDIVLRDLDEYDSFFVLMIIAFLDENFSLKLTAEDLKEISTIKDLIEFIGTENFTS
tara:strand:+ start:109 stop:348 length:240 start_codon:yes stop_codon:yes gene_type:complete